MCSVAYATYIWNIEATLLWVVRFADACRHITSD